MPKRPGHVFGGRNLDGLIPPGTVRPLPDPQIDPAAFDELIQNRGLRFLHEKAAFCPHVSDTEAQFHDPNDHTCQHGYIYFETNGGKPIFGIFQQNKLERMYEINGLWDTGQAIITFSAYNRNPEGEPGAGSINDFKVADRLTCLDFEVSWQERVEHSITGLDRLKYPATSVEFLADAERRYLQGSDYELTSEGHIRWLSRNRPKLKAETGRGGIFTIVYGYHPVFLVKQVMHEVRASKGVDRATGELKAIRLPQQVLVQREYMANHPGAGQTANRAARDGLDVPE